MNWISDIEGDCVFHSIQNLTEMLRAASPPGTEVNVFPYSIFYPFYEQGPNSIERFRSKTTQTFQFGCTYYIVVETTTPFSLL